MGFMVRCVRWVAGTLALCLCLLASAWAGGSVVVSGIFGDKALLAIDGGPAQVMRVGEQRAGVKLIAVQAGQILIETAGQRRSLALGSGNNGTPVPTSGSTASTTVREAVVYADARGHFIADGQVNGVGVQFVVDTGASVVTLPKSVAVRAGVVFDSTRRSGVATAGGIVPAWQAKLNAVQLGGITLHLVDAVIIDDASLPVSLLGMSFLNRTTMTNEAGRMTLKQRY